MCLRGHCVGGGDDGVVLKLFDCRVTTVFAAANEGALSAADIAHAATIRPHQRRIVGKSRTVDLWKRQYQCLNPCEVGVYLPGRKT
jgi:hypothetical protein